MTCPHCGGNELFGCRGNCPTRLLENDMARGQDESKTKELVYTIEATFDPREPGMGRAVEEALEALRGYGAAEIIDVNLITRPLTQEEMRG